MLDKKSLTSKGLLCPEEKLLNYNHLHRLVIYLISTTMQCQAVQSGCNEGQQSSRWLLT